jgi:hypothetical protein
MVPIPGERRYAARELRGRLARAPGRGRARACTATSPPPAAEQCCRGPAPAASPTPAAPSVHVSPSHKQNHRLISGPVAMGTCWLGWHAMMPTETTSMQSVLTFNRASTLSEPIDRDSIVDYNLMLKSFHHRHMEIYKLPPDVSPSSLRSNPHPSVQKARLHDLSTDYILVVAYAKQLPLTTTTALAASKTRNTATMCKRERRAFGFLPRKWS